jgi:plastocyanin
VGASSHHAVASSNSNRDDDHREGLRVYAYEVGMDTNESFSFKFEKPGTYHFTCSIRPHMVGTVVVEETP